MDMHMSDALLSPIVGGGMYVASAGVMSYSIRKIKSDALESRLPLMGVMGAFLFAAQMINFAVPGTGSSGHIGGGMLLSIILGPSAGFLTMACVLLIQALFFADGGIIALGCNLINLGFFTCYFAYPFIFSKIIKKHRNRKTLIIGAIIASIVGLQLGSLGVVIETILSGRTELGFGTFLLFMQPIHLAIGIIEGLVTASIIVYLEQQNPDLLYEAHTQQNRIRKKSVSVLGISVSILVVALTLGGAVSLIASSRPDGLEWAIQKSSPLELQQNNPSLIQWFETFQQKIAVLPSYGFGHMGKNIGETAGTSVSGIVGSLITLAVTFLVGGVVRKSHKKRTVERVSDHEENI